MRRIGDKLDSERSLTSTFRKNVAIVVKHETFTLAIILAALIAKTRNKGEKKYRGSSDLVLCINAEGGTNGNQDHVS